MCAASRGACGCNNRAALGPPVLLRGQVDLPRVDHALRGVLDAKKRNAGAELQSVADEHRRA